LSTTVTFEYGTTTSYGQTITAAQNPVSGGSITNVTAEITGLTAGTTFHFRVKTVNSLGTIYSNDMTFTTLGKVPTAITLPACCITNTGATLNGTVIANYLSTSVTFEYGTTTAYGNTVNAIPNPVTGNNSTNVSANLSGLNSGTIYHFRVKAVNSLGITTGSDDTLTTISRTVPFLTTDSVALITQTTAVSGGNITNDGGEAVTARGVCWSTTANPTTNDNITSEGTGTGSFASNISGLTPGTTYYIRAYATNNIGTAYGDEKSFKTPPNLASGQIIADHTIVDRFDDIPQQYIDLIKKMWVTVPGESHSGAYRTGMTLLEASYPAYAVSVVESGTPEPYTTSNLRFSSATWGDYWETSGWIYGYGEEDWWTNATAIAHTKSSITYCNTHSLEIAAIGFGWCWDLTGNGGPTAGVDPVYGCKWWGSSWYGPSGNLPWGLDNADNGVSGNTVNLDTYLAATQSYIDYCTANGYSTKVFFTTGPVDTYFTGECGYQGHLKHERIRDYVDANPTRILFDYADILCYNNDGTPTTTTWSGHTYPTITSTNYTPTIGDFHISNAGALRLAKAMWWMLARIAGWDGK
jgi:hypothetical protein